MGTRRERFRVRRARPGVTERRPAAPLLDECGSDGVPAVRLCRGHPAGEVWHRPLCVLLKDWIATALGIIRPPSAAECGFHTATGTFSAWFTTVALRLGYPNTPNPFEWLAPVGFVPEGRLPESAGQGIFGIGGGLERFLRVELVLSPHGIEMPVVRIATPDP